MKTELYYFTGTGNGLFIAKSIKEELELGGHNVALVPINTLDLSESINAIGKQVGIVFPTYAMSAPAIVKQFAKQLNVSKDAYVYLYGHSGGGGAKGSLYAINRILTDRMIKVSNTFETAFPSNSTMMTYTPEKLETSLNQANESLKQNIKLIANNESGEIVKPTFLRNTSAAITEKIANTAENMLQFKVIKSDDACIGCSLCEKVCPMGNIEMEDGKPKFGEACEMCMSCINQCPQQSLAFGKMKKKNLLSYRHPKVEVKELMYR